MASVIETLSPELRLALALLSADPDRRSPENLKQIAGPGLDWSRFVRLVIDRHGVAPLIARRLEAVEGWSAPEPWRGQLERSLRANIQQHLLHKRQLVRLQRALLERGIEPILVKGLAIEERFYEHGGLRETGDIDLLVDPAEVAQCDAILCDIGYRRLKPTRRSKGPRAKLYAMLARHFVYTDSHTRQTLELHWRLTKSHGVLPPAFWRELDGTDRLAVARSCSVPVLAPLAQFMHVAVHGAEHAWASLKWLADLSPMIASLGDAEWQRLLACGRATQLLPALLLAANLARLLLDVRCNPLLLEAIEASDRVQRLTAGSIRALQEDVPSWEVWGEQPSRYLAQFRYELGISGSLTYRAGMLGRFPFYYLYFLSRSWTKAGRQRRVSE